MLKRQIRALANRCRTVVKFDLLNSWVIRGKHIRCPMNVWFWAPNKRITLGDYVQFGPGTTVQCDITFGNKILVARNVAFIGRADHRIDIPGKTMWDSGRGVNQHTYIEDDVWIGHGAVILSGVRIGRGSVIAAGSVVTHDLPAYSIAAGVPARVVRTRFTEREILLHESVLGYDKHNLFSPVAN